MPEDVFARFVRKGCHGLQIPTGTRWRLAVVDVDGAYGLTTWEQLCVYNPCPTTVTGRTPRDGWQFYFAIPDGITSLPKVDLWKGAGDHQGIELLADRCLARCAPSYKEIEGCKVQYRWIPGRAPWEFQMATLPQWIIDRSLESVKQPSAWMPTRSTCNKESRHSWQSIDSKRRSSGNSWRSVLDSVHDKVGVCSQWGLRVVGTSPNQSGWIKCRSIFREDRNPSAMFQVSRGIYWEPTLPKAMSYVDVMMALRGVDISTVLRELEQTCRAS